MVTLIGGELSSSANKTSSKPKDTDVSKRMSRDMQFEFNGTIIRRWRFLENVTILIDFDKSPADEHFI